MARWKPFVRKDSYMPNNKMTPLVIGNGYTTDWGANGQPPVWDTAIGNPVTFNAITPFPLKQLQIAFSPVQDLHGYDAPWPAGGHYNQWDEEWEVGGILNNTGQNADTVTDAIRSKNYTPVTAETDYCFVNGSKNVAVIFFYESDHTFISNASPSLSGGYATFTTPADCAYVRFKLTNQYGTTYKNDVAINYPSSITTYSPYSNICPISGFDSVTVNRTGKNMLDDGYSTSVTNEIVLTEGTYYAQAWLIENPSQHTTNPQLLIDGVWTNITPPYSGDGISITGISFGWLYSNAAQTITVDAGKKYSIRYNRNNAAMQTRRLSFSITELSAFEPYQGNTYTIQLGETVYSGTLDVLTGVVTVDSRYFVADGTNITTTGGYGAAGANWLPAIILPTGSKAAANAVNVLADSLKTSGSVQSVENSIAIGNRGAVIVLHIGTMQGTDGTHGYNSADEVHAAVKTYLQSNPIGIWYRLATPFEIPLTPVQIATLHGTNNVWSDANGDLTVEYRSN